MQITRILFTKLITGRARGGAYAGASAGYGVGSSAAIGGDTDEFGARGGIGSEAHANGISTKTVKLSQTPQQQPQIQHQVWFLMLIIIIFAHNKSRRRIFLIIILNDAPNRQHLLKRRPL